MTVRARRKICVITGSRADYGLLYWLLKDIQADPDLTLQVVATGMHLSPEFGLTDRVIDADGFVIDRKVEMLLSSDTPVGVTKSIGLGVIGFADALAELKPDIIVLLGDRFEILAAAQAALIARIPVAHIAGGDTTEGAFDESIRHAITKMAHLHFVTNPEAGQRVRQMGENPEHVYDVGSPGIDYIRRFVPMARADLERELNFRFRRHNLLVTFHPVTLAEGASMTQLHELLVALHGLGPEYGIVFTLPNADTEGRAMIAGIERFAAMHDNVRAYASLGQLRYLSLMSAVDVIVGNSSSGLYEAPSLKKPTVNIGDRQKGRLAAATVLHCPAERAAIAAALEKALALDCTDAVNPYGDGRSSERILAVLKNQADLDGLVRKHFFTVS